MNPEAQVVLDNILKKDPETLTREERDFLRARRGYLKKAQTAEYQEILEMQEEPVEKPQEVVAETPEHLQPAAELEIVIPYNYLLKQAKSLGYKGPRVNRGRLNEFIKENSTKP